jgi:hypothetical protein
MEGEAPMLGLILSRKRCFLLPTGLFLALIPSTLIAQEPAFSSAKPAADSVSSEGKNPGGKGEYDVWIALIGVVGSLGGAFITAKLTSKKEVSKISWNDLLSKETIEAIRLQGSFVTQREVQEELRNVVSGINWTALLSKDNIDFIKNQGRFVVEKEVLEKLRLEYDTPAFANLCQNIFMRGKQVIELKTQNAQSLMDKKDPDAKERMQEFIRDSSAVYQLPLLSPQARDEFVRGLIQQVAGPKEGGGTDGI